MTDLAEKTHGFACQACDTRVDRWMPRCPSCGQMGMIRSLVKIQAATLEIAKAARTHQTSRDVAPRRRESSEPTPLDDVPEEAPSDGDEPIAITEVSAEDYRRISTGIGTLDRVLGGGMVVGSLVLIGGNAGCGKSTLTIQACARMTCGMVLYATGEESAGQVASRARRVDSARPHIQILREPRLERVISIATKLQPAMLVVDSVQTLTTDYAAGATGSATQVRECAKRLMDFAKTTGIPTLLIGHVTKDGGLAGPKTLEHLVDATFLLEPYCGLEMSETPYRILRSFKNRFGDTTEKGAFEMRPDGMHEAFDLPDEAGMTESLVPVAQEILNRYRQLGGDVDEGLRDRIAGRLSCDEELQ